MLNRRFAVPVSIVLSGFVLMLPVARQDDLSIRGGIADLLKRNARRIHRPFYAAVALFLALSLAVPFFRNAQGTQWSGKVPLTHGGVVAHLLHGQNVYKGWHDQIDGPLWSVVTESQMIERRFLTRHQRAEVPT